MIDLNDAIRTKDELKERVQVKIENCYRVTFADGEVQEYNEGQFNTYFENVPSGPPTELNYVGVEFRCAKAPELNGVFLTVRAKYKQTTLYRGEIERLVKWLQAHLAE